MKLSDPINGGIVVALGVAAYLGGRVLPDVPGQQVGPAIFPMVVGAALVICGLLIVFGVGQSFEEEAEIVVSEDGATAAAVPDPKGDRWRGLSVLIPPALLLFYAAAVDHLGFILTAALMVVTLALSLGASRRLALAMALFAPPIVHVIFLKLLRVPLPSGLIPMPW